VPVESDLSGLIRLAAAVAWGVRRHKDLKSRYAHLSREHIRLEMPKVESSFAGKLLDRQTGQL